MPGVQEAKYSVHINMQKCKYVLLDIVIVNIPLRSGLHTHICKCVTVMNFIAHFQALKLVFHNELNETSISVN